MSANLSHVLPNRDASPEKVCPTSEGDGLHPPPRVPPPRPPPPKAKPETIYEDLESGDEKSKRNSVGDLPEDPSRYVQACDVYEHSHNTIVL